MTEKDVTNYLEELKKEFPDSFNHPSAHEGEIFAGDLLLADKPEQIRESLEKKGVHARLGPKVVVIGAHSTQSIFVSARDFVLNTHR